MIYDALDIAKYIVDFCNKEKFCMPCRKLQSTLYFLQADFLVNEKHPLFKDDLLTNSYGIIIEKVENHYKVYGNASIPSWSPYDFNLPLSYKEKERLERMLKRVNLYTSTDLLEIIFHQDPFKNNIGKYKVIPLKDLYIYFR